MTAERGGVELVERLSNEWREMCRDGPADQPFYQPEWLRAFVRAFAPGRRLLVITARVGGRLTALLPLIERRQMMLGLPVRMLVSAANVHSGRFDLARTGGPEGEAATRAVWDFLTRQCEWHLIVLENVPEEGALSQWAVLAQAQGFPVAGFVSMAYPYFPLAGFDGDCDSWPLHLKGDFRRELRRRARKLAAQGNVQLRREAHADPAMLQRFFDLEASGWKGRAGTAIASEPSTRQFYDEIAEAASQLGYLSLYFLEVNGRPIAGHFGLTYGSRYFVPKLGYDEEYAPFSPGQLLVGSVAQDCATRGVREFDFLGPWMEWKGCWTSLSRPLRVLHIFRDDALGRTLYAAKFGWKAAVRSVVGSLATRARPVTSR